MKRITINRISLSISAAALLGGCGGGQPPIGAPSAPAVLSPLRSAPPTSYLYVAHCCGVLNNGDVTVYAPGETKVVRRIVRGAFDPIDVLVDRKGTLYVLNQSRAYQGGISITEFDRGSRGKYSRRISGFYWADALALDKSDDLYVANCNTCNDSGARAMAAARDSVTVYRAEETTLLRTITQGIHKPSSLAFDGDGNLYVANGGSKNHHPSVTVYAAGSGTPLRTITKGITHPGLVAVDKVGDLFVTDGDIFSSRVIEYAAESDKILRKIGDEISGPDALSIGDSGTLYVSNWPLDPSGPGWVSVYEPGNSKAKYRIVAGIDDAVALALDRDENLYVANVGGNRGRVTVYAQDSRKPLRSMMSDKFGEPRSLALGSE